MIRVNIKHSLCNGRGGVGPLNSQLPTQCFGISIQYNTIMGYTNILPYGHFTWLSVMNTGQVTEGGPHILELCMVLLHRRGSGGIVTTCNATMWMPKLHFHTVYLELNCSGEETTAK